MIIMRRVKGKSDPKSRRKADVLGFHEADFICAGSYDLSQAGSVCLLY